MALYIYKWNNQWLRRATFPRNGLPGWALHQRCCCVQSSSGPIDYCCGCEWLEDYWLANKSLKCTLSGALVGEVILPAEPELVIPNSCSRWRGDDFTGVTDDCTLGPSVIEFYCFPSDSPTGGMRMALNLLFNFCNVLIPEEPDSASCGPPLDATWTGVIEDAGSETPCDCVGETITFEFTNDEAWP